jgi:hypothetical protein
MVDRGERDRVLLSLARTIESNADHYRAAAETLASLGHDESMVDVLKVRDRALAAATKIRLLVSSPSPQLH